ncbi:MAG: hypothetical protein K9I59_00035 [Chlorobium sp.]|jgi:hypothetical protein|uniref:LptE family protein n=1 Tax=Chlorobium sp. TaxID=1095 RepID=UPI0025BE72A7|nr:LptE family protein [Chlorobium sp.]MCF8215247.1 hypothetical protein [Chlorobium sp.]MCF8270082.1 hypothetical protein [Chlorobium sp.]MCF8286453.1 hypothetical protein [Chlorobium sp.]MCF8290051.1 hypothetical protein [Chlorobium sp.]MCF8384122.1 hypothetical protein [Chlorobium sp.]
MRYSWLKRVSILLILIIQTVLFQGCYSFSGGSVPPHIKTVAVPVFQDRSRAGIAQFRADLTRKLTEKIESQSPLRLTPSRVTADAILEGTILSFTDEPSQLSSTTERALTNRITITVQAVFQDRVKKSILFERNFTGFADYASGFFFLQQDAIAQSLDMIAADILDAVVSDWH